MVYVSPYKRVREPEVDEFWEYLQRSGLVTREMSENRPPSIKVPKYIWDKYRRSRERNPPLLYRVGRAVASLL